MIWKEVLAIKNSTNLNFKLPEYTDNVDIEQINENFTAIDNMFEGGVLKDENIPATVARSGDSPSIENFNNFCEVVSNDIKSVEENLENHKNDLDVHFSASQKAWFMSTGLLLSRHHEEDLEGNVTDSWEVSTMNGDIYTDRLRETLNVPTKDETYSKEELYTKEELDTKFASIVTDIFSLGTTAPENTKLLWIDTTAVTGGLKYYNGTEWVHVPVAYN